MDDAVAHIEFQELSVSTGDVLQAENYTELLASYLLQNDLCNAKFLWKRIPSESKANEELAAVWRVGKNLWTKDLSGFYADVKSFPWSNTLTPIINQLIDFQREKNIRLIGLAYSSIQPGDAAKLLGTSVKETEAILLSRGWQKVEGMILPDEKTAKSSSMKSGEDQLGKLTDFVSFLEN